MQIKKRFRPDKDGKDKTLFMAYRRKIFNDCKDSGYINCGLCGLPIDLSKQYPHPWSLVIDHIIPIVKGGSSLESNLQPAHNKCNRQKGDKLRLTIDEVNKLRAAQMAPPIDGIAKAKGAPGSEAAEDLERALRGFPQSVNWRTY